MAAKRELICEVAPAACALGRDSATIAASTF
jgi:hypothetical protein